MTMTSVALATAATDAFADGNRLFRDDLYWAALLRYHQAQEAGLDSPLLHYNMGIAHYRAQQHIRARASLLQAAQSPTLRVLSHYNLGLNAYAAGDVEDALNWFRQARDQQENEKIRELAIVAIARLNAAKRAEDPVLVRAQKLSEEKPIFNFDLTARVGFGSDDNVFRTPNQTYVDFSDPALPVVTPEIYSGAYYPVNFNTRFSVNSLKWESFFAAYRLSGKVHTDPVLNNADEFSHELRFGSEFDRREGERISRVYSAFTIAQHDEIYYDPDNGQPRVAGTEEIDDRMNYVRYGPELALLQRFNKLSFGLRIKGQLWDYDDTEVVPEYDHEYFLFGGNVQYKFAPTSLLRLTIDKSSRRYNDRTAYDLNGNQLPTNPGLRYDYIEYGLLARQRITRNMWFGFGYEFTDRMDRFVGYNDYQRDSYKFEFNWSPHARFDLEANAYYRIYDYPNAFAFHNPIAGLKTLETADGTVHATFRLTRRLSIEVEADYREVVSTDARIGYDRMQYSIGVVWRQ
ncbi:MAG: hypothetical protein OEM25_00410 [Gammaproteobacteria bacterium]|nr:hypothetical protein [Gammaproteobacteria bacterium]